ncbi:MAG: hypothetical protein PF448_05005 [Bacteroidales bacterium]|nr:hypothetical protein [Bacteroidales bacterium]
MKILSYICPMRMFVVISFFVSMLVIITSCERNPYTTSPSDKLTFSTDTVQFDTIFTSIGSTTQYLTVINPHNKAIKIDEIVLAKGDASVFRLNIDGRPGNQVSDVEIAAEDSLFIFVELTINPSENDMVEQDSIVFVSNGNAQDVDLVAFGQNVFLVNGAYVSNDTTWTPERPILIYNSVLVEDDVTLQIEAGTQLHFHYGSSMLVNGTLKVHGEKDNMVVFQGDRLESAYDDIPGQWGAWITLEGGGIYLLGGLHFLPGSKYNEMRYAEVKNSIIGIRADTVVTPGIPTLTLDNCIVQHMNVAGLYGAGAHITAENSVFSDCGQYTAALLYGGLYDFRHCTFANYYSGSRQSSSLALNNYLAYDEEGNTVLDIRPIDAYFGNCIIYGNLSEEIMLDLDTEYGAEYLFENSLIKTGEDINNDHFVNVINNQAPKFIDPYETYDFRLDSLSPAIDAGKIEIGQQVPTDFDGNSRLTDEGPDLGAFERID